MGVHLRAAKPADTLAIYNLVTANLDAGHLLPRSMEDIAAHISKFFVAEVDAAVAGCAELARLSPTMAEVRSLVVQESSRGQKIGTKLIAHLAAKATIAGYGTLCAFTHDPAHFVRLGFTIVPHIWMPEKIAHDCIGCSQFRRCGQYAVRLPLRQSAVRPERSAAMVYGRGVAPRRPNIERMQLTSAPGDTASGDKEEEPAEGVLA